VFAQNAEAGLVVGTSNNVVAHNVFARSQSWGGLSYYGDSSVGNDYLNNIFFQNVRAHVEALLDNRLDHSVLFPENVWSLWSWAAPCAGSHLFFLDPLFVDESANDYRTQPGSPCRGAAGPVKLLGARSSPDIGLFPATLYWEPELEPIPDVTIEEGSEVRLTAKLREADPPTDRIAFGLAGLPPEGASVDPATGAFTWTPNETHGPGVYHITVVATADDSPIVSAATTFAVTVNEVNQPPVVALMTEPLICNPSFEADEFTVWPGYIRENRAITGWTSPPNSGVNSGTFGGPFSDNGLIPDGNRVAFVQEDGALSQVISGFDVGASYQLEFFENARNGGLPGLAVTIGGATIVPAHTVTPVGGNEPYRLVTSTVFQAGAPQLELAFVKSSPQGGDSTVLIDNVRLVALSQLPSERERIIDELTPLAAAFRATDPDVPGNHFSFALISAPANVSLDSASGILSWTPTEAQGPSTNTITVRVTDDGVPPLSATNSFTVVVRALPRLELKAIKMVGGGFTMVANGVSGQTFTLQVSADLSSWTNLVTTNSTEATLMLEDRAAGSARKQFYRLKRTQ